MNFKDHSLTVPLEASLEKESGGGGLIDFKAQIKKTRIKAGSSIDFNKVEFDCSYEVDNLDLELLKEIKEIVPAAERFSGTGQLNIKGRIVYSDGRLTGEMNLARFAQIAGFENHQRRIHVPYLLYLGQCRIGIARKAKHVLHAIAVVVDDLGNEGRFCVIAAGRLADRIDAETFQFCGDPGRRQRRFAIQEGGRVDRVKMWPEYSREVPDTIKIAIARRMDLASTNKFTRLQLLFQLRFGLWRLPCPVCTEVHVTDRCAPVLVVSPQPVDIRRGVHQ